MRLENKNILNSQTFKRVMYFKFFMVICIWGLIPLLIPVNLVPVLGLHLNAYQIFIMRIWGIVVLLDTFLYLYIYKKPHTKLVKYFILFAIIDNGGFGLVLLLFSPFFHWPWGIWINAPFQLFFGYWFYRFFKEGKFDLFWSSFICQNDRVAL